MNWPLFGLIGGIIGLVFCAMALSTAKDWRALLGFTIALNIHTIFENLTIILKH